MNHVSVLAAETAPPVAAMNLVGSWLLTIFETDGPPTRGMVTLHADGTLVAAEHPVVTPPGAPGPIFTSSGHGSWQPSGKDAASFVFVALGSEGTGRLFAIVTIRGTVAIDAARNSLTGEATATLETPSENQLATFPLRLRGVRIAAEAESLPLPGTRLAAPMISPTRAG